jgi:hypothetical protein
MRWKCLVLMLAWVLWSSWPMHSTQSVDGHVLTFSQPYPPILRPLWHGSYDTYDICMAYLRDTQARESRTPLPSGPNWYITVAYVCEQSS